MPSELRLQRPEKDLEKWKALPLAEKKEQFQELVESPYWYFLPDEVRVRIRSLLDH